VTTGGHPDVAVIGAGIVGVSIAAHLAAAGARVTVHEGTSIGAGASGRNSGIVQHPFDPDLVPFHLETLELYRRLALERPESFVLPTEPSGLLAVAHDTEVVRRLATGLAASHPQLEPRFLAPGEATRLEPLVDPSIAACRIAIGYPVAPAAATVACAAEAGALGAVFEVGMPARPWFRGGRLAGVTVAGRERPAGAVVVAAGPSSPALVDSSGAWRPIRPVWGAVVDIAIADPPRHVLEQADLDIEPGGTLEVETERTPRTGEGLAPGELAFSLVPAGATSALGSTFLPFEPDPGAMVPLLVDHGSRFVPAIASARIGASRACARPQSFDGRPLLGRVPGIDGLWIAAGHGPWGISTGPAGGRLVADLVLGRVAAPPPGFDPARFSPPLSVRVR